MGIKIARLDLTKNLEDVTLTRIAIATTWDDNLKSSWQGWAKIHAVTAERG
jgi:hypothetical protein